MPRGDATDLRRRASGDDGLNVPILDLNTVRQLSKAEPYVCGECGHAVRRNYCRECDVFFEAGHEAPGCRSAHGAEHETHRTY